jgi:hypothetical protein
LADRHPSAHWDARNWDHQQESDRVEHSRLPDVCTRDGLGSLRARGAKMSLPSRGTEGSNPSCSSGESVQTWLPLRAAADEGTGGTRNPWDIERAPGEQRLRSRAGLRCDEPERPPARSPAAATSAGNAGIAGRRDRSCFISLCPESRDVLKRGPTNFFNRVDHGIKCLNLNRNRCIVS